MARGVARDVGEVAETLGVDDLMVFEMTDARARLRGGHGRGAGWAGVVELDVAEEPLLSSTTDLGRAVRIDQAEPVRVIGPYWSAHAALVRTGDHVVAFGATAPIRASSAELASRAIEAVAAVGDTPPSKLLADELELVQAIRQLTDHTARSLGEAATHVADVAADSLSCEIGAVLLKRNGTTEVYGAGPAWPEIADDHAVCVALHDLADRAATEPILEQDMAMVADSGLRIVSCYALGIGRSSPFGALIVGHSAARPRGFTQLCQRVGRALADAAEPALLLAMAHEDLAQQRDRFAAEARTDGLTTLANRVAWHEALDNEQARRERRPRPVVLLAVDVDDLKHTNDTLGHAAGDELLVAIAEVLRSVVRESDLVARIGGDEFAALLIDADPVAAEAVRNRVIGACERWSDPNGLTLRVSVGWAAPLPNETLREAFDRADAAMYAAKRGAA